VYFSALPSPRKDEVRPSCPRPSRKALFRQATPVKAASGVQFLQCPHPPKRLFEGKQPRVHKGFLQTWTANGIRDRVLAHVADLLASAEDRAAVRVLACGHSLGGAVATLAAFDIAREFDIAPCHVTCYTFGCPRVGNHAFAAEYEQMVPDTWHVVNDQDVVVHGMKLFGWYKRNGNRVILDGKGGIVVRPSLLELSLLQVPCSPCAEGEPSVWSLAIRSTPLVLLPTS
jgi:hypothetical protein